MTIPHHHAYRSPKYIVGGTKTMQSSPNQSNSPRTDSSFPNIGLPSRPQHQEEVGEPKSFEEIRPENAFSAEIAEGIHVHIWPRFQTTMAVLRESFPSHFIAVDGFVKDEPQIDFERIQLNMDHHACFQAAALSSSGQCYDFLQNGLIEDFFCDQNPYRPRVHLGFNDADQDTQLVKWLFQNHERVTCGRSEPLIKQLVDLIDHQDRAAGLYPFIPTDRFMRIQAWIFDPYVQSRQSGALLTMDGSQMFNVFQAVSENISRYADGQAQTIELNTDYEVMGGGKGWKLVREIGFYARAAYRADQIKAFIAVNEGKDGSYYYAIGRTRFNRHWPIELICTHLNTYEDSECWGPTHSKSASIGGSRGGNGSTAKPHEVEARVNEFLEQYYG